MIVILGGAVVVRYYDITKLAHRDATIVAEIETLHKDHLTPEEKKQLDQLKHDFDRL